MEGNRLKRLLPGLALFAAAGLMFALQFYQLEMDNSTIWGALLGLLAVAIIAFVLIRKKLPESTSHGSAGWATDEELKKFLADPDEPPDAGALMLGPSPSGTMRLDLPVDLMLCHSLIIGPT